MTAKDREQLPFDPAEYASEYNKLRQLWRETGHLSPAEETRMPFPKKWMTSGTLRCPTNPKKDSRLTNSPKGQAWKIILPRSVRNAFDELPEPAVSEAYGLLLSVEEDPFQKNGPEKSPLSEFLFGTAGGTAGWIEGKSVHVLVRCNPTLPVS